MTDETALPYAGTEGYAGSDTSRERALREAIDGVASKRQRFLLILASRAKERGVTVADVRDQSLHHGRVSGALSVLHKTGKLARLRETRERCKVYVLPEYVNGRETEPHGVIHKADKVTLEAAETVDTWLHRYEIGDGLFDLSDVLDHDDVLSTALQRLVDYAKGEV